MKKRSIIIIAVIAGVVAFLILSEVIFSFITAKILEAIDRLQTNKAQIAYDEAKKEEHDDLVPFSVLDSSSDPPKQMVEKIQYNERV